jgi:DNA-binding response OmpR family regulator
MRSRVLLVDDDRDILRVFAIGLRRAGFNVETAETGEGALAAAAASEPDVVVLDLVLPDRNGTDVCHELRARSDTPVLMLTAVDEEPQRRAAFEAGAAACLRKPIGLSDLLARLRNRLRREGGGHR